MLGKRGEGVEEAGWREGEGKGSTASDQLSVKSNEFGSVACFLAVISS